MNQTQTGPRALVRPSANPRGFTLVEVMIVSALIAISAYFVSETMVRRAQQQRAAEIKDNFLALKTGVDQSVRNPAALLSSAQKQIPAPVVEPIDPNAELNLGEVEPIGGI